MANNFDRDMGKALSESMRRNPLTLPGMVAPQWGRNALPGIPAPKARSRWGSPLEIVLTISAVAAITFAGWSFVKAYPETLVMVGAELGIETPAPRKSLCNPIYLDQWDSHGRCILDRQVFAKESAETILNDFRNGK